MPSLSGSRRRHSKQAANASKKKPPPDLTLATRRSSSSNASDTQATPRSIFSSSLRPSRRPTRDAKPVTREEALRSHPIEPPVRQARNVDVFAYMERDGVNWSSPALIEEATRHDDTSDEELSPPLDSPVHLSKRIEAPQMSPRYSDLEVKANSDDGHHRWGRASLHSDGGIHSDSGISVHSGSPEQDSPIMHHKYPTMIQDNPPVARLEPSILEDDEPQSAVLRESPDYLSPARPSHRHMTSLETSEGWVPEACQLSPPPLGHEMPYVAPQPQRPRYSSHSHLEIPLDSSYMQQSQQQQQQQQQPPYVSPCPLPSSTDSPKRTGYALLASSICSRHQPNTTSNPSTHAPDAVLKPIYRKFETLQNRMLLYLQDEISELEAQLSDLDHAIAAEPTSHPESRRCEAKLPSQLQWHRMDLLSRVGTKIEIYNRALTSYATLAKTLSPSSCADVEVYRHWIEAHTPLAAEETAFLDQEGDLVTVGSPLPPTISHPSITSEVGVGMQPGVILAVAFMATITIFKVVPYFFARVVVGMVVGVVCACAMGQGPTVEGLRRWVGRRKGGGEEMASLEVRTEWGLFALVVGVLAVGL